MKYTKGKWFYRVFKNPKIRYGVYIQSDNGDNIAKIPRSDNESDSIQEANAKLICAAPDLLEALLKLREHFEPLAETPFEHDLLSIVDQAIKKAVQ